MGMSRGRATFLKKKRNQNEVKRQLKLAKKLRNENKKAASEE